MFIFGGQYRSGKRSITRAESWALRLQPFNFETRCVPGDQNIADVVSRLISNCQADEPFDENDDKHILYTVDAFNMSMTWSEIQLASEEDKEIAEVRLAIQTGHWPRHLRRYECLEKQLRSLDALVFKNNFIVLPKYLRKRAIETSHEGHVGCGATKRILREHFWWPNMSKEAQEFVSNCATCLAISRRNPPVPLSSRELPEGPWEKLQIDFLSLQGCGSEHFLVCVDTYSRFLHVVHLKSTDAKSTNIALCNIFKQWGLPSVIQSDNGPPFKSKEFIEFWEQKGVKIHKSIPLSAQSNGAVERQNQGIIKAVSAAKVEKKNWNEALQEYVQIHNTRKHHSRLNATPFELLVGWRYRGSFPGLWERKTGVDRMDIREDDAHAKLISKKYADDRRGAKESSINVGDKVVVAVPQRTKTDRLFSEETFTVLTREGAKIVVRGENGNQFAMNIQDFKLYPSNVNNHNEATDNDTQAPNATSTSAASSRPQRNRCKPAWWDDMEMY
ncbi:uncharacterized protein K02A2.6-like isoform X1 [Anopheles arabiensis]|uniref:uncharacterized protein K02A2.6-like isoform X1 n=1 Tax=Anopheles arabiensis TaxID=7173 RepID=UPI001AADECCB|nr:uncharacterized protein K02A2.6-like isoform X1 [Anopheles arabiensis]